MLRDEDAVYRSEMKRVENFRDEKKFQEESVEELKKKLEIKRAERALYYPNNYRSLKSFNGFSDSVTPSPKHYLNERHIHACRNSQASMGDTNLRNYSSLDNQGHKEMAEIDYHGEKRHGHGKKIYGTDTDSFGDSPYKPIRHTGERRHYEASIDSVDEGTNPHYDGGDADNASVITFGDGFRNEQERTYGYSGHAPVSERRHYGQHPGDCGRSLANTNLRQVTVNKHVEDTELEVEQAQAELEEAQAAAEEAQAAAAEEEAEAEAEAEAENEAEAKRRQSTGDNEVWEQIYDPSDQTKFFGSETRDYDNQKNWSTDNINFSWKYDDPAKRPVCFLTHNELLHQIQDLENRELQACKKQNWSEALRLRDMRNRLELQREIEVFNNNDLNINREDRRSQMMNIANKIKLMDKREIGKDEHLIYSEEARDLWEARVREDEKILSKHDRAKREILLKELEEAWAAMSVDDKHRATESPVIHAKSQLQEELELTAAAINKEALTMAYHASNEESKNSCTRNKDKGASSLIFLG